MKTEKYVTNKTFTTAMSRVDQKFTRVDLRFENIENRLDKLTLCYLNLEKRMDETATKADLAILSDKIMARFDDFAKKYEHLDNARLIHEERITRLELNQ